MIQGGLYSESAMREAFEWTGMLTHLHGASTSKSGGAAQRPSLRPSEASGCRRERHPHTCTADLYLRTGFRICSACPPLLICTSVAYMLATTKLPSALVALRCGGNSVRGATHIGVIRSLCPGRRRRPAASGVRWRAWPPAPPPPRAANVHATQTDTKRVSASRHHLSLHH